MFKVPEHINKMLKHEDVNFQILTLSVEKENVLTFNITDNTVKIKKNNKVIIISRIFDSKGDLSTEYTIELDKKGFYDLPFPLLKRIPKITSDVSKIYTKIKKPFKLYVKGFGDSIKNIEILLSF